MTIRSCETTWSYGSIICAKQLMQFYLLSIKGWEVAKIDGSEPINSFTFAISLPFWHNALRSCAINDLWQSDCPAGQSQRTVVSQHEYRVGFASKLQRKNITVNAKVVEGGVPESKRFNGTTS